MSHSIRPATLDDVPMLAQVVLLASRSHCATGVFDLAVPSSDTDRLSAIRAILTTEQVSWCHYTNFLVACVDGEPAAALAGYAAYDQSHLALEKTLVVGMREAGLDDDAISQSFGRTTVFVKVGSEDEAGAWVIEFVACLEAYRRRGLIRALLDAMLERGRERGHDLTQLTILIGNHSAQRAYEQAGFEITYEKTHPEFEAAIGCPGLARMLRRKTQALEVG